MNLAFDFSVDKKNNTITIKREFDAELPLVWDAYTKSEFLDQWWGPKPWKARTKLFDFREGGKWLYAMVGPNGEEHWAYSEYRNIQLQKKFTGIDGFSDAEGNIIKDMPQSKWSSSFASKGQSTLVTSLIEFDDVEQLEAMIRTGFKEGHTMALENLEALLPVLKARAKR